MPTSGKKHNPFYQAQAILSRRDHAEAEVREKLSRKGFSDEQIEATISWLKENKLINDKEFARKYSESILLAKPVGPMWVRMKLRQRGVASSVIENTLNTIFSVEYQQSLVQEAITSWRRTHAAKANDRVALWRHLAARGFSPDIISRSVEDA